MNIFKTIKGSILVLILFVSCAQETVMEKDTFIVSGTIKGLDTEYMRTSYTDDQGIRITDSIPVINESFKYKARITKPTFIIFWPNVERTIKRSGSGGYYPAKSSQFAFFASPGDNIKFKGEIIDFIDAYPSGTHANNDLAKINSKVFPIMNTSVNLLLKKNKLTTEDLQFSVLEDSINMLDEKVIQLKKSFVISNPASEAAAWYLSDMMLRSQITDEEAINAFKSLDPALNRNPYYNEVETRVKGIETTRIGEIVPDFSTNRTMDGSEFHFSKLKGKYILIDFWGTWCGPCVAEMPKVKQYHEKYKDKLIILGINSGDTKEKIRNFIEPKGYDWTQILSGKGADNLVLRFNVAGFPTKFIIDPEGKILHRFVGDGEQSFEVLDELLK